MPVSLLLVITCAGQPFLNGPPHDELPAHDPHRLDHGLTDHRFAASRHQTAEIAAEIHVVRLVQRDHAAGQHQCPGRRIHEQRRTVAEMPFPIRLRELRFDQLVGSLGVGYAQQCLGETHQDHALPIGKLIFLQKRVQTAGTGTGVANAFDQLPRPRLHPRAMADAEIRHGNELTNDGFLRGPMELLDAFPARFRLRNYTDKHGCPFHNG
jgi:hypothetical protein